MLFTIGLLGLAGIVVAGGPYQVGSTTATDLLAASSLAKLTLYAAYNQGSTSCTLQNVAIRREWGTLSSANKIAYINAMKCLMAKPSLLNPVEVPGAKNRFDDFVAVHINQTIFIHGTANFLSWHRYFTYAFEQALRNECGYTGYQPYWNWGKYAHDPLNSPIFDGSATSVSGNGDYVPHSCTNGLPTGLNCIPPGTGGGCVTNGPFANMSVNLGPIAPTLDAPGVVPATSLLAYNPRCLRRDISSWVSSNWTKDSDSFDLITNYPTILSFQNRMQGDFAAGFYGVHTGGHFIIGGDPGGDLFASPGDPAFYLHHAQIDRTWWIWQNQNPAARTNAIGGATLPEFLGPSPNGTLADLLDLGVVSPAAGVVPIADVMSIVGTGGGPLCYIYL
ncbi:putative tyrosinase [Podospora australis]|uniref:Tyrosinase n=1 Tax=Podospora australis TaxID=1536484 RepID=A0AAN7AIU4_9PEZI|nr:putative tyrosinase [Podospora australis]